MSAAKSASDMLADAAERLQPRLALESGGAAPEHGLLGELGLLLGDGQAVESEELRAGAAVMLANEAPSRAWCAAH
jgi:hypothetical protein